MVLIEVTSEQFNAIWNKMQPQQRIICQELRAPSLDLVTFGLDAVLVTEGSIEMKSVVGEGVELTIKKLIEMNVV